MHGDLVTIVKDGRLVLTAEENLCKEDVVVVQAGDLVPADLKLVEAVGLEADEFDITGEILPVYKNVDEHEGFLYMGSRVTKGIGKGMVIATGEQTEFGRILKQRWENDPPERLHIFQKSSLRILWLLLPAFLVLFAKGVNVVAFAALLLAASFLLVILQNDAYFKHLIVSDEKGKFEQLNIQIHDLQALESLSEIDMICFDKTGVLTTRSMEVKRVYYGDRAEDLDPLQYADIPSELVIMGCALCNEILFLEKMDLANPIDKALIAFSQKNGVDLQKLHAQYKRVYDQPFDSENRSMACGFEREDHATYFFMKGDPAVIVNKCTHYLTSTGATRCVNFDFLTNTTMNIETINHTGGTVIALAYSPELSEHPPANLIFLCLLQLENSLQPGVRELIRHVSEQRIRSVLLTGDRAETAARVGVECGIAKDPRRTLTGRTIQYMALAEIARQSAYCSVFARLLPSQKAVLVRMFQQGGHSVVMIGDGTNDGLALKAADIGISFLKNSSPFARRLSKILINELPDMLTLIEGSHRLNRRIGNLETIRLLAMVGVLLSVYGCVFAWFIFNGRIDVWLMTIFQLPATLFPVDLHFLQFLAN